MPIGDDARPVFLGDLVQPVAEDVGLDPAGHQRDFRPLVPGDLRGRVQRDRVRKLLESGASLLVIEHNLDVIKTADYVIDLGPEGGEAGGYVVATGTPEEIMRAKQSYTGKYLRDYLARSNGDVRVAS